ncbi:MAG: DUF3486 family protein [Gammaproteobacteria bacterium]|nr:DUF3486 family protein [Gammaproteobacteria bacterium]
MADRKTKPRKKRRPGAVDRLPADVKGNIQRLLDDGWTKTDITAAVNAELAERGLGAVSRESVNRYTLRIEREGARIREINSAAEAFARRAGSIQDAGAGAYVKQLARTLLVDRLHEADSETPIKDLSQLVLAIRRIEGTSEQIDKRAKAAVEQAERESAARAEEAMRGEGLSDATIAAVRARILGAG